MSPIVDFSAGYLPPGVYVETQSTGSIGAIGVGQTVLCLVGEGIGYQSVTENISFAGGDSVVLSKKFIDAASLTASATLASGKTQFTVDTGGGADFSLSTVSDVTTMVRHPNGLIPTDRAVTVVYHYADDNYFALNRFGDYPTLTSIYGQPLDPVTGAVVSPISFAAQQAFRNGANVIYVVAVDSRVAVAPAIRYANAYIKLMASFDVNLVVPLWTAVTDTASASTYLADLSTFLDTAADNGMPMMALCGVMAAYSSLDPDTLAAGVANRRVVLFWPPSLTFFNPISSSNDTADGIYLAAAVAGAAANQNVNRGLTRTQIRGFTGIPADVLASMTTSRKNTWASKGVSVIERNRLNQLVVRHGVTTDVTDIGTREISIVRCQDVLLEMMQLTLEGADLIGDAITNNTPIIVASLVQGALENALADAIIANYTGLVVNQQSLPNGNPTVVEIVFAYRPTYPLNYVTVSFTLDLTTNAITATEATTDTAV